MKIRQNRQISLVSALNCLKLDKNLVFSSLFVVLIGVFLLPNNAFASPITSLKIIKLTNIEREKAQIMPVSRNEKLTQAAQKKGEEILKKQIFDHNIGNKRFSTWVREADYEYSYTGENLAIDFITSEGVMSAWVESSDHRKNLLNPDYQEIGIAILEGNFQNQKTIVVVQIFGTRLMTIVPDEILKRDEHLKPRLGEVLSANEYRPTIQNFGAKKRPTTLVDSLLVVFSVITALALTYFYLLFIIWLISITLHINQNKNKKNYV